MNACFQDEKDKSPDTLQPFYLKQKHECMCLKKESSIYTNYDQYLIIF